jgi:hypothetical protein
LSRLPKLTGTSSDLICGLTNESAQFWPGMVEEARMDAT